MHRCGVLSWEVIWGIQALKGILSSGESMLFTRVMFKVMLIIQAG